MTTTMMMMMMMMIIIIIIIIIVIITTWCVYVRPSPAACREAPVAHCKYDTIIITIMIININDILTMTLLC